MKNLSCFTLLLLLFYSHSVNAQGSLMVMPKRIVFDGKKKAQEINLANTGTEKATYVISFQEIRMTELGQFETITNPDSGQLFASGYLRVFPKTVTLEPNETQTIKIQLTAAEMKEGEYRSHLYLRAIPKEADENEVNDKQGISIKITPIFGFTVPVIVQIGEPKAEATLADGAIKWQDEKPLLSMTIKRNGNKSLYGNITVKYISPEGTETQVGLVKGLAVYTPTPQRHFLLPLEKTNGIDYTKGKIQVSYEDDNPKPKKFSETEFSLK